MPNDPLTTEWGTYQHRLHARVGPMRAAEYRVPVMRLASSGISQVAWPDGRLTETRGIPGHAEILAAELPLKIAARRPLDRWLAWPAVLFTGVVALWGFWLALWERKPARRSDAE